MTNPALVSFTQNFLQSPKEDFKRILAYWLNRNKSPVYPQKLTVLIETTITWISENPQVRQITDFSGIYIKIIRDYQILFEEDDNNIFIHPIWDTRQNPNKLKKILPKKKE